MARILSQIYFLLSSISGIFMGMNCILFSFCMYVLWGQNRRLLLLSSITQFVLCIAQVALHITYLIGAFTRYPGGAEDYFRYISVYFLPSYIIYIINYAIEGFLLIWRIYALYNHNIKICIPSIILLLLQVGFGGVTAKGYATEAVISGRLLVFDLVTWGLIAAVNISATLLICLRLWIARQSTHAVLSQSKYKSAIIVVVECGALVTICTISMLILYAVEHPGSPAGLGVTTQIATMAPLLIIARYGILSRQDDRHLVAVASQMPLRISVVRTEVTHVDTSDMGPSTSQKNRMYSDSFPDHPDGNYPQPFRDM